MTADDLLLGEPTTPACDTCGGSGVCLYPSIDDQALVRVLCPDCTNGDVA